MLSRRIRYKLKSALHGALTLLRRATIVALCIYVTACWLLLLGYDRQLTFRPDPRHTAPAAARLSGVTESLLVTPDGARLVLWRAMPREGQPTILYYHGNGDGLIARAQRIQSFQAEGFGVYMMAYRGYSGSTGKPSEEAIIADAQLAYRALRDEGLEANKIVIYGEFLGTSVALQVAKDHPSMAVILEAPFTSMHDAWRQFVPYLPVSLLVRDRFASDRVVGDLKAPLLIMHGHKDPLVRFTLGRGLYELAPQPKRFEAFPLARHANLYNHGAMTAVRNFITDVGSGRMAMR